MAPIHALSHSDNTRHIFDDIDEQFQLNDDRLTAITKQFLADFHLGLSEYNHAMAMMCACARSPRFSAR